MRPWILVSAAVVCLSASGNAVYAALGAGKPKTSDVASPVIADRNLGTAGDAAEHRRLISFPWSDDKDEESSDFSAGSGNPKLYWRMHTLLYDDLFYVVHRTQKQAEAYIKADDRRSFHEGYLVYVKTKCKELVNKGRQACA
uniref:RxLR effector protein n=1 Tax=Peronospora matthiolae TaxID=2874970 RepID=A0AAV1USK4_9STRA